MPTIIPLDAITISQIAAGEVIERPASIVKELLENCLDAGASTIRIDLQAGGKKQIRISDNGCGIEAKEFPLAFQRYATSKIRNLDDLYQTLTYGFRGEALFSVSQVAEVQLTSKTASDDAYQVTVFQDRFSEITIAAREQGTTLIVNDLFLNLPVRAKFLKSTTSEFGHCYDIVLHYALTRPDVDFVLTADGQERLNTTGLSTMTDIAHHLFGKDFAKQTVPLNHQIGDVHITGLVGLPTLTLPNRNHLFINTNGRLVKSALLQKAACSPYKDVIPHGRFPFLCLDVQCDPHLIDVNAHPQKLDIKFLNSGFLFDALHKAITFTFKARLADLQTATTLKTTMEPGMTSSPDLHASAPFNATFQTAFQTGSTLQSPKETFTSEPLFSVPRPSEIHAAIDMLGESSTYYQNALIEPETITSLASEELEYLHVFETYIIVKALDKVWILDQHAVHERVLYENIKSQFETFQDSQPLLISKVVELPPSDFARYLDCQSKLAELGFITDPFGTSQFVIREVPLAFSSVDPQPILLELISGFQEFPEHSVSLSLLQKEQLQMKACKAAIKAGKRMPEPEVRQLILDLVKSPNNYTCPHGRPLFVTYGKQDLEKLFLRT